MASVYCVSPSLHYRPTQLSNPFLSFRQLPFVGAQLFGTCRHPWRFSLLCCAPIRAHIQPLFASDFTIYYVTHVTLRFLLQSGDFQENSMFFFNLFWKSNIHIQMIVLDLTCLLLVKLTTKGQIWIKSGHQLLSYICWQILNATFSTVRWRGKFLFRLFPKPTSCHFHLT